MTKQVVQVKEERVSLLLNVPEGTTHIQIDEEGIVNYYMVKLEPEHVSGREQLRKVRYEAAWDTDNRHWYWRIPCHYNDDNTTFTRAAGLPVFS